MSRIITIIDAEPITVTSLNIASSSSNNFANAGKTITVTLVTDGTDLGNFTVTLLGRDIVKENVNSGTVTFTATVFSNDTNGNATFSITATNSTGNRILVTNDDIADGSFVTIDTVSPTITLNGENNTLVALGASYTDPGATASDTSYANDIQISAKGNVIVNQLGNYILTYTAPNDPAGNVGPIITRTVMVQDLPQLEILDLTIETSNNKSSYAKTEDTLTVRLTVNDTITVGTVSILGLNTTPSINNNSISANLIIPTHIAIEEHVTFVITVKSNDGAQRKVTQKDLSVNDTIFVDTVAPRIYLIGAKNHAVLINSTNPFIPGAVVVDGDPDHPRNHSITTNGTLNTFIINSVIIYTYTAEPDGAGNLGSSVTRTV